MKKFYSILVMAAFAVMAAAQTTPTKMKVNLSNGTSQTFSLSDINDITFEADEVIPPAPVEDVLEITIPTDFSTGLVQKAVVNGNKIAEICYEYVKPASKQMVVVYPVGSDGKADLTKGIAASDGGSVV